MSAKAKCLVVANSMESLVSRRCRQQGSVGCMRSRPECSRLDFESDGELVPSDPPRILVLAVIIDSLLEADLLNCSKYFACFLVQVS